MGGRGRRAQWAAGQRGSLAETRPRSPGATVGGPAGVPGFTCPRGAVGVKGRSGSTLPVAQRGQPHTGAGRMVGGADNRHVHPQAGASQGPGDVWPKAGGWARALFSVHRRTRAVAPAESCQQGRARVLSSRGASGRSQTGCDADLLCVLDVTCTCCTHARRHKHTQLYTLTAYCTQHTRARDTTPRA